MAGVTVCAVMLDYMAEDCGFGSPCWIWQGATRKGKPLVRIDGSYVYAHRKAWEDRHGVSLESTTVLMRQCAPTKCVNPEHYRYSRRVLGIAPREQATPEQQRVWNLRRYGITPEQYDTLLAAQGGVCAVCRRDERDRLGRRLHVDHDHETDIVRGLLCTRCNAAIGLAGEDAERLRLLAAYLEGEPPSL